MASRPTLSGDRPPRLAGESTLLQLVLAGCPFANSVVGPPVEATDWPAIVKAAEDHGLKPLLYKSLQNADRLAEMPPDIVGGLRAAYVRTGVTNWLALDQLAGLLEVFERAQIPAILLKGAALGPTIYGDASLRPMTDLDLLIRHADAHRARDLLFERGFLPQPDLDAGFSPLFSHEQAFERVVSPIIRVDLHTHLLGNPYWHRHLDID